MAEQWTFIPNQVIREGRYQAKVRKWSDEQWGQFASKWGEHQRQLLADRMAEYRPPTLAEWPTPPSPEESEEEFYGGKPPKLEDVVREQRAGMYPDWARQEFTPPEPAPASPEEGQGSLLAGLLEGLGYVNQQARERVPGVAGAEDIAGGLVGVLGDVQAVGSVVPQYAGGLQAVQGPGGSYPRLGGPGVGLQQLGEDIQQAGPDIVRQGAERWQRTKAEALEGQPGGMQLAGELALEGLNPATWLDPSMAGGLAKGARAAVPAVRAAAPKVAGALAEEFAPDVLGGLQRAGAIKMFAEEGIPGAAAEGGRGIVGKATQATGADPTKAYEFRYRVASLDELIPSHTDALALNPSFPQELQPRLRDRAASRLQVNKIASELVPEALLSDVQQLDRGPMIVGADNIVESGNGRILALRRAREAYPEQYAKYQEALRQRLPEYGIDPASVQGVQNPVLVRERVTPVDRAAFAAEANEAATLTMSAFETALQDAGRISDNALAGLQVGESQSLDSALQAAGNRGVVRQFVANIPENERAAIIGPHGELSQPGLQRLKAALFARTYPGESGQRLTQTFFESLDPTVKNVEQGMMASLPAMGKAEGLIRAGLRDAELSLSDDLSKAVNVLANLREQGMGVDQYLAQASMFGRELNPFQETLLKYLSDNARSPKRIREFIGEYANAVEQAPVKGQGAFFDMGAPGKGEILDAIAKRQAKADAEQYPLFAQAAQDVEAPIAQGPRLEEPAGAGAGQAVAPQRAPEPLAAPVPAAGKEPWQMTLDELNQTGYIAYDTASGQHVVKASRTIDQAANASEHERQVAQAVAAGKPVPAEVLAEYPGLAGMPPGAPQAPISAPSAPRPPAGQPISRPPAVGPADVPPASVPSAQPSRPFTPPARPGAEDLPLQVTTDPATGQARFAPEGPTPPQPTLPQVPPAGGLPPGAKPIDLTKGEEVARLRLDKFPEWARDTISQSAESADWAREQRRGVVPTAVSESMADDIRRSVDQWITQGKAGKAYNTVELRALRNTLTAQAEKVNAVAEEIATAGAMRTTDDMLMRQFAEGEKLAALVKVAEGARAEWGRAGHAFQAATRSFEAPEKAIQRIHLKMGGEKNTKEAVQEFVKLRQQGATPVQQAQFWAKVDKPPAGVKDWFEALRYNSMLSGPRTFEINLIGNALEVPWRLARDTSASLLRGRPEELGPELSGMWVGAQRGVHAAMETLRHGITTEQALEGALPRGLSARVTGRPAKAAALTLESVSRPLQAGDEFAKSVAYSMVLGREAAVSASKAGLRGDAWKARVADTLAAPEDLLIKKAQSAAERMTYKGEMGALGEALGEVRKVPYLGNILLPFLRTVYHISARGIDRSPLGLVGTGIDVARGAYKGGAIPKGAAPLGERLGDNIMGAVAGLAFTGYAMQGNISGAGPDDPRQRDLLRSQGWQPYAIKLGDNWVSYSNWGPVAMGLAQAAAIAEANLYREDKNSALSVAMDGFRRFAELPTEQVYLQGIGDLYKAIQNPEAYAGRWLTGFAQTMVPFGAGIATTAQAGDPYQRRPEKYNIPQALATRFPGARESVPIQQDVLGRDIPNPLSGAKAFQPFRATPVRQDAIAVELSRLGMGLSPAGDSITLPGTPEPQKLTSDQQRGYQRTLGQGWQTGLTALFDQPYYQEAPDEDKKKIIQAVENKIRGWAQDNMRAELQGRPPTPPERITKDATEFPAALGVYREWQAIPSKRGMTAEAATEAARITSYHDQVKRLSNGNTAVARQMTVEQFGSDALAKMQQYKMRPDDPRKDRFWQQNRQLLEKYFKGAAGADVAAQRAG